MHSARELASAPPTDIDGAPRRGGRPYRSSHRRGRPRRRGLGLLVGTLLAAGLLGSATFLLGSGRSDASGEASSGTPRPPSTVRVTPTPTPTPTPSLSPSPSPTSTKIDVPSTGTGTFVAAHATGAKVGDGARPLRYAVEVETGIDISPARAADEIADILSAPRGWTRDDTHSFQLVSAEAPHDLTVRIATPGTADALCWAGIHQDTGGEYNCETPGGVVVNLRRWVRGSPTFDGPIHDYRALIVNHEMGHFLGYTHMTCAGPGQLAPVMMQQIKGLHGCVANAWPYDRNGHFVSGPHVL
ncbi:DUF3152 domain-containing protein [Streptomyces sp. NBC_01462]|uniref:DUF3152 domain-containing protein n=1 Tax=Streptomyces sp. NBC_01462 TaxID=2903876 RepID=UPI002E32D8D7|nr:DUF3152 domain-containing protein [Streptomyces sp. NBC_01462]